MLVVYLLIFSIFSWFSVRKFLLWGFLHFSQVVDFIVIELLVVVSWSFVVLQPSVVLFPFPFNFINLSPLYIPPPLPGMAKALLIFVYISKSQLLVSLIFSNVVFVFISFISALNIMLSFIKLFCCYSFIVVLGISWVVYLSFLLLLFLFSLLLVVPWGKTVLL